jgi:ATP-dependent Clp protease ATP-binding subunit ClpB
MNLNKYTEKAQEAVLAAQQLADRAGNPELLPEHVLLALVQQKDGIVPAVLAKMTVDPATVEPAIQALIDRLPRAHGGAQPGLSARLRQVLAQAEEEAARLKDEYTSTEHLLLAITGESGRAPSAEALKRLGVTKDAVFAALAGVRGSQRVTDQNTEANYQALDG